jgi:uncharacterized protein (DUF736 family)
MVGRPSPQSPLISQLTLPPETITSCHPGYAIPNSNRIPDGTGATEFGAAWKKTARETDREYLSVKLDDPSFPAPIYASLVRGEGDDSYTLIWSRRSGD